MHLNLIREPNDNPSPRRETSDRDARLYEAMSRTVDALAPRERVRGLVAARLFGEAATPARVGRFELQRELGVGGMGAVYAAHDPRLERVVALKVLQRAGGSGDAERRLLREAQAMARLRHPNVVQVYEAGSHGGQVHIAMEMIEGGTLGDWMGGRARPWSEVRDIMLAAGRGLAAAHAAGLIHRDFKPGNVLMDIHGQPRVSDFGLARGAAEEGDLPDEAEQTAEFGADRLLEVALTRTGAILGTPAYMSAEQFRGEPATPRSDQFAFCVVVWEALCGQRPYVGETMGGLLTAVESGSITATRGVHLPRRLRRVLARGLSPQPGDRYPSMVALLADLEQIPTGRRGARPRLVAASLMAASLAAGIAVAAVRGGPSETEVDMSNSMPKIFAKGCLRDLKDLSDAWSPAVREEVKAELLAAEGMSAGNQRSEAVLSSIDRRYESLRARRGDFCEMVVEGMDWSRQREDYCLSDRETNFTTMLESLRNGPPFGLGEIEGFVSMDADPSACAGAEPPVSRVYFPEGHEDLWEARRSIAWAFAPGAGIESVHAEPKDWTHAAEVAARYKSERLAAEVEFTKLVIAAGEGGSTLDLRLLESFEQATADALVARDTHTGPLLDLRARAAVLVAEVHRRAQEPNGERARELAADASAALEKLPVEDPLRIQLGRQLEALWAKSDGDMGRDASR